MVQAKLILGKHHSPKNLREKLPTIWCQIGRAYFVEWNRQFEMFINNSNNET